jgi:predicted ATPase/DNA-binding CsgD family transcriptional regulator
MEGKDTSPDQLTQREKEILARLSTGLTDQQIAADLFLSFNTVRWYNRQIYSKLGVSSRTQAIAYATETGLLEKPVSTSPLTSPEHNLPAQTTLFIGREREIAAVKRLLKVSRLLTLSGAGGIGKTRLALQAITEVTDNFTHGIYFIDLAPLSDHTLVVKAIAGALGVVESPAQPLLGTLKRSLGQREILLIIDNFEHVITAAPLVSELLAACPRLKVIVTSRESLRLSGEQEYAVPPLSLPTADGDALQSLTESEAGMLFVQRVQMKRQYFEVSRDNAAAIVQICTRLDGLPLAIELAAARCKLLTPQALIEWLERPRESSPLLAISSGSRDAPLRHRTLWDTIEWSYNLLDADERRLFERLAVFRGGRSLDAVEAICGEDLSIDVYDLLGSLLDKNLVQQNELPDGEPRFVLLEMIHEYAREQLEASGEAEMMRRRHAEYFVALAEQGEPELRLARYDYWCERFEPERDNIRAVLEWSLAGGDVTLGVRLAKALGLFWYGQGYHVEALYWIKQLLERLDEAPRMYHPQFLICAGRLAFLNDLDAGKRLFERSLKISHELSDKTQIGWALIFLAYTMQSEPETAMPLAEESLALFREMNHQPGIANALNIIGEIARVSGDDERAKHAYEQCLAVCQQTGEVRRISYNYLNLAYIAQHEGEHERALDFIKQALQLSRGKKDTHGITTFLMTFSGSIAALGQPRRAARLLGASEVALKVALEGMGTVHKPADQPEIERIIAAVRAQLDGATFEAAWDEGSKITLEQAVADALEK